MKRITGLIILGALIFMVIACESNKEIVPRENTAAAGQYSPEELKKDFKKFRRIMEKKTVGLYTDRERLEALLDEAEAALDKPMTELEFYRLLAPAVAALRCGHSFLSVSEEMEDYLQTEALFFPLEVRIIRGRLFVIADRHDTGVVPGTEVLKINGMPAGEVVRVITANMPTDGNDTGRPRYDAERWFASMYYGYVGTPGQFELEVLPPEASVSRRVVVPAVRDASLAKTARGVVFDTARNPWSGSFHDGYGYLRIPFLGYPVSKGFGDFLKDFFTLLAEKGTDTLILDVRGNYGGSPPPTIELFQYLINEPLPFFGEESPFYLARWKKPIDPAPEAFQGNLYVLMDEAAFSMNSFLLSLLKYHGIGTLVGEKSSGGFLCSDASRNAVLGNTGLRLRYSTGVFATAVEGLEAGKGIEPDLKVEWTLQDYLEGNDPVLEAVLGRNN